MGLRREVCLQHGGQSWKARPRSGIEIKERKSELSQQITAITGIRREGRNPSLQTGGLAPEHQSRWKVTVRGDN